MNTRRLSYILFAIGLLCLASALILQGTQTTLAQEDADPHGEPGTFLTGYYDAWVNSPHARFEDRAFTHWDEDGEIQESCAACHSTPGYEDYLGVDGSAVGVVDAPAPLGTVVNCDACHNQAAASLTSVTFPSGVEVTGLEESARCMVCHQGRASGFSVANAIEEAGLTGEPNTVSEDLRFINIHYYAAASSLYGSEVHGGYEFPDKVYYGRNEHVEGYDSCYDCHAPHTLELQVSECADCHEGADSVEAMVDIRMPGTRVDYDGDGDVEEGLAFEIETLQELLYQSMQMYSATVVGTPIGFGGGYPYYFIDTDGDGTISEEEGVRDNAYNQFTPVLLQATYNYQVSVKDPGGYAHNPDYHIQILYDSIEALNMQMEEEGVDVTALRRDGFGHFQFTSDAFRHWDEDGEVSASCSKCHTAEGLPFFMEHGTTIAFEPSNSLACTTCHNLDEEFSVTPVMEVEFPSGLAASFGEDSPNNMCLNCHQGRESTVGINQRIANAGVGEDEVSEALSFRNPHYFAAGATLFGTEVKGAYEFEGMEYNSMFEHTRRFDECSDCHEQHELTVRFEECTDCHEEVETAADVALIRAHPEDAERFDYDGDGDMDEPIAAEIETLENDLFELIVTYADEVIGTPIVYDSASYPYWYVDTNANGVADSDEVNYGNAYNQWTPNLVRAVYNYLFVDKDPGAYSHNADYALQVLYDTLFALGGEEAVEGYFRPLVDYYE